MSFKKNTRREFLKKSGETGLLLTIPGFIGKSFGESVLTKSKSKTSEKIQIPENKVEGARKYNGLYFGSYLDRIAFPIGGIGAGMICLEGTGAISHVSVRNKPDMFNEPLMYAALFFKNKKKSAAKIIEGQVPRWKRFGDRPHAGRGFFKSSYGYPRFESNTFLNRFPFAEIKLKDEEIPFNVSDTGWSPFIPGDDDNSSLPVGAFEYHFVNSSNETYDAIFSFNSENFMRMNEVKDNVHGEASVRKFPKGFLLWQEGTEKNKVNEGGFAFFADEEKNVKVDYTWFRSNEGDFKTITWNNIRNGNIVENPPVSEGSPGASLFVPFSLKPGELKTIKLKFCWYVPNTDLRKGSEINTENIPKDKLKTYKPWYSGKFKDIYTLADYWKLHYNDLREKTQRFTKAFYSSTLPGEVLEAVGVNLSILKSPTILRQTDGRLWGWEGCGDDHGLGPGSCSHVWNYAQSIPHLFPKLERSLRETEFNESLAANGFLQFRASLPIRKAGYGEYPAADAQLGTIIKVYREWRISGDTRWLKNLWPHIKKSMNYCINKWDPKHKGLIEEAHHNTYDIEFWGPEPRGENFYLGALKAMIKMANAFKDDTVFYEQLLKKGKVYLESRLFNGEYFFQKVEWKDLVNNNPIESAKGKWNVDYDYPESKELFNKEGPKYQYGKGCLSDGVFGLWLTKASGIDEPIVDPLKVKSHLKSVYKYNLRNDLSDHANPQRPGFAMGHEGGLLLCTWPKGGKPTLPFIYCDEVWTGIEYQVASHLISEDMKNEGLRIVRICRKRYDERVRNPFDEYEYGNWYARAMASYGLLQALTGIRYDALDQTLYIDSKIGNNFKCFISTETGFGIAGLKKGMPFIDIRLGRINVKNCFVSNNKTEIEIVIVHD